MGGRKTAVNMRQLLALINYMREMSWIFLIFTGGAKSHSDLFCKSFLSVTYATHAQR